MLGAAADMAGPLPYWLGALSIRFGDQEFDPAAGHDLVVVWGEVSTPLPLGVTRWLNQPA